MDSRNGRSGCIYAVVFVREAMKSMIVGLNRPSIQPLIKTSKENNLSVRLCRFISALRAFSSSTFLSKRYIAQFALGYT